MLDQSHGRVMAICLSEKTGEQKRPVSKAKVLKSYGLEGDAHAGDWHRQVSLLAQESIDKIKRRGLAVSQGDFAENIITQGIELTGILPGASVFIGDHVKLVVTQIGKECHDRCAIYEAAGDCVMPREGIFTRVESGGVIKPGDSVQVVDQSD